MKRRREIEIDQLCLLAVRGQQKLVASISIFFANERSCLTEASKRQKQRRTEKAAKNREGIQYFAVRSK